MMNFRVLIPRQLFSLYFVFTSIFPGVLLAEQSIKRMVITDCNQAKEAVLKVPEKDRIELVNFLGLILKRRSARPDQVSVDIVGSTKKISPFESPLDENSPGDISGFFDPTHEKDAKSCALVMLRLLGAQSQETVPNLVDYYADRTVPEAQRFEVAQTIYQIAKSIREEGSDVSRSVVHLLVPGLLKSDAAIVRNFFIELGAKSLLALVEELQSPDAELRGSISRLIQSMELDSSELAPALGQMIEAADPMVRLEAQGILQSSQELRKQFLENIIAATRDMHPDVRYKAANTLGQFSTQELKSLDSLKPHLEKLLSIASASGGEDLDGLWSVLRTLSKEGLLSDRQLLSLLANQDERIIVRALGMPLEKFGGSLELGDRLTQLVKSKSVKVQALAISALGRRSSTNPPLKLFTEVLRSADKSLVQAISAALMELRVAKLPNDLLGALLKGLPDTLEDDLVQSKDAAIQLMLKVGGVNSALIIKDIPNLPAPQKYLAVRLMSTSAPSDQKVQDLILSLVANKPDRNVVRTLEHALMKPTKATIKSLYRLLRDKSVTVRGFAARVLSGAGEKDASILPVLVSQAQSPDCLEKSESLWAVKSFQGSVSAAMLRDTVECAKRGLVSRSFLETSILRILPVDQDAENYLLDVLEDVSVDSQVRLAILSLTDKLHFTQPSLAGALVKIFESKDNPFRLATIEILAGLDSRKLVSQKRLMEVLKSNGAELMLIHEMAVMAANTDGSDFDAVEFFVDELHGKNSDWAIRSLGRIPSNAVGLVVDRSLDKLSTPLKVKVLGVAAAAGGAISALAPKIGALMASPLPEVQHAATQALINIQPSFPALKAGVTRMLFELGGESLAQVKKPLSEEFLSLIKSLQGEAAYRFERVTYSGLMR